MTAETAPATYYVGQRVQQAIGAQHHIRTGRITARVQLKSGEAKYTVQWTEALDEHGTVIHHPHTMRMTEAGLREHGVESLREA